MAPVTRWGFAQVRRDPEGCCRTMVENGSVSYTALALVQHDRTLTTLEASFSPPPEFEDFPQEVARITVLLDGTIMAVPLRADSRAWWHRYPAMTAVEIRNLLMISDLPQWHGVVGALCLEFPDDPERLRWDWGSGLDTYLQMVQRHLLAEEFARRYGYWPVEDAPHGYRPDGKPHPIVTPQLRAA